MIGFILLAILAMALSVPLFLVFGAGSAAIAFEVLGLPLHTLMQVSFDAMTKQVLVSIPIFIFAGAVMLHGGSARRLVDLGMAMVGHLPGGMAVALILAIGIFSAISGSILASIVAIGSVMMPPMIEKGYPKPFVVVLTASAALIDALIPPSNTAIIFSAITHVPVSKTFAAGVFPGLVLMGLLLVYSMWYCRHIPRLAGLRAIASGHGRDHHRNFCDHRDGRLFFDHSHLHQDAPIHHCVLRRVQHRSDYFHVARWPHFSDTGHLPRGGAGLLPDRSGLLPALFGDENRPATVLRLHGRASRVGHADTPRLCRALYRVGRDS